MKFGELMQVFKGYRVRVKELGADGEEKVREINLLDTVDGHRLLARYSEAAVVRFSTGTLEFDGQMFPALEVTVRV